MNAQRDFLDRPGAAVLRPQDSPVLLRRSGDSESNGKPHSQFNFPRLPLSMLRSASQDPWTDDRAPFTAPPRGSADTDFSHIPLRQQRATGILQPEDDPAAQAVEELHNGVFLGQARDAGETAGPRAPDAPDAGPAPDAGQPSDAGAAPRPAACMMTSATTLAAPDGTTAASRTSVGPAEEVTFNAGGPANWTATTGSPVSASAVPNFIWRAPEAAGTTTITASFASGATCTKTMTTVAPSGIAMTRHSVDTFPAGTAGAGMLLEAKFSPLNVSFGNVGWLEDAGPASSVSGYFTALKTAGQDLSHHPNPSFVRIGSNNTFRSDHAAGSGFPAPWSPGGFSWSIPNRYNNFSAASAGTVFTNTLQAFTINATGTVTIAKGGASVSRSP